MDELALSERRKYETLWRFFPEYRNESPADYLTSLFLSTFPLSQKIGETIIDFGCGPGRSAKQLSDAGLKVILIDICENSLDPEVFLHTVGPNAKFTFLEGCLWNLPADLKPAEWMICFDVLEHLPEEKIDASLKEISSRMKKGGLFSIALCEDVFGIAIGKKLHLTIQPKTWWRNKIAQYFLISKELITDDTYLVVSVTILRHRED